MGFGDRLAAIRKERGLTQEALGKGLGTEGADAGKSVVYGWERKGHFPRADQAAAICDKLRCSADYLLRDIKPVWPFTKELQDRVSQLADADLLALENVMRAHLRIPTLPEDAAKPDDAIGQSNEEALARSTESMESKPKDRNKNRA